jgi:hypothetical protein
MNGSGRSLDTNPQSFVKVSLAVPTSRHTGPPMTLGNMRANGVRRLLVSCGECHHTAVIDVDGYGDEIPVPTFGPRMLCTYCGAIGCDARPNWTDRGRQHWSY